MSSGHGTWLLLAGPAGGIGLYWALFRYYRNTDKSFAFERETAVVAKPVTGSDQQVGNVQGTQEARVDGDNVREYRRRVQRIEGESQEGG